MPDQTPSHEEPRWMRVARALYREQFDGRSREDVLDAMDAWGEDGEELFILSHLSFLNLLAQRDLLLAHRELLDGLSQVVSEQRRSREVLVKLGRLLNEKLGELADILDEEEQEDDSLEDAAVPELRPVPEAPARPVVLEHPVPDSE